MKTKRFTATLITTLVVALSLGSMPLASAASGSTAGSNGGGGGGVGGSVTKQKTMQLMLSVKTTPNKDRRVDVNLSWNDLTEQPMVGKDAEVEYTVLKISKTSIETLYQGYNFRATDTLESGSDYYYMVYATLTNWDSSLYLTGSQVVNVSTVETPKKVSKAKARRIHSQAK